MTNIRLGLRSKSGTPPRARADRGELVKHAVLAAICLFIILPILFMLSVSVKSLSQVLYQLFAVRGPFYLSNYTAAWQAVAPFIKNSLIMASGSAALAIITASLAGYAFAKLRFPGRDALFWVIFVKMLLPGVLNLIPSFVLAWHLGLLNTYWVVILFAISAAQPFWVFVMRTFIRQIPQELFEAARMDGAAELQTFWLVVAPLLRPMLMLMGINVFIAVWNDYVWPLVTISSHSMLPIGVGLADLNGIDASYSAYGPLMAGYAISMIPLILIFIIGARQFVEGLSSGAVKL